MFKNLRPNKFAGYCHKCGVYIHAKQGVCVFGRRRPDGLHDYKIECKDFEACFSWREERERLDRLHNEAYEQQQQQQQQRADGGS